MKKLPLYNRAKEIVGYTLLDDIDFGFACESVWRLDNKGYANRGQCVGGKYKHIYLHREIAQRAGLNISQQIDHVNQNKLDNQRTNLRSASRADQMRNRPKRTNNTSGFVGVSWNKQYEKWIANIRVNGKQKHLGLFDDPLAAGLITALARIKYHGLFAANCGIIIDLTEQLVTKGNQ